MGARLGLQRLGLPVAPAVMGGGNVITYGPFVSSPSLSTEIFGSGRNLEGVYTAGLCAFFNAGKNGTPILAESADAYDGSKAQSFIPSAVNDSIVITATTPSGLFYRLSCFGKRLAGAGAEVLLRTITDGTRIHSPAIVSAAYAETRASFFTSGNSVFYLIQQSGTNYDTVLVDAFSLKPISMSSIVSLHNSGFTNFSISAPVTTPKGAQAGVVLCATTDLTGFVMAFCDGNPYGDTSSFIGCYSLSGGTTTKQRADYWGNHYVAGNNIEAVKIGNQVWVFYDYLLTLAQITVPAGLVNNTVTGVVAADENASIPSHTVKKMASTYKNIMAVGDSKVLGSVGDGENKRGWVYRMRSNPMQVPVLIESPQRYGVSGQTVATAKVGIDAYLAGAGALATPDYIVNNLGVNDFASMPTEAAFLTNYRYIIAAEHTKYADAKIYICIPWKVGKDTEADTMAGYIATLIADDPTYIIQGVDERVTLKGSDNGATYTFDGIHPNAIGYQAVADTTRTILGF